VYAWPPLDELVVSSYCTGFLAQGKQALHELLSQARFPDSERSRIAANQAFFP
jgi:hypothetical protein